MLRAALLVMAVGAASLSPPVLAKASMSDAEVQRRLGDAKREVDKGRYDQAAATLEKIVRARPDDPAALRMLCEAQTADASLFELEPVEYPLIRARFDKAAGTCARAAAVETEPDVTARRSWARTVVKAERVTDAVPAFQAWSEAEPNDPHAVGGLAAWLEETSRPEDADSVLEAAAAKSKTLGQRVRFEFACQSAGSRHVDRLRPVLDALMESEAMPEGKAMIDVLKVSVEQGGMEGMLAFLDLIEHRTLSDGDAHHLWTCFDEDSAFSMRYRRLRPGPGVTFPRRKTWFNPEFPDAERFRYRQGKVLLVGRINVDGTVFPLWVARASTPNFGEAAVDCVRRYRYEPGKIEGQPVPYPFTIRVDFRLRR